MDWSGSGERDDAVQCSAVKMMCKDTMIAYNKSITIKNIPLKAFSYQVNSKNAIDWAIEHCQIAQNKDKFIKNNLNDYIGGEYVFRLIKKMQ